MKKHVVVEVCTASIVDSLTAFKAGADRIELNSALDLGGLSPSPGVLKQVLDCIDIPVIAMVRPHPGGFVYTKEEKKAILYDAELFLSTGAAGIAVGALTTGGTLDTTFIARLRQLASMRQLVFHRAFDLMRNFSEGASVLSDLGVNRILTSGGCRTAPEGSTVLKQLVSRFAGQIEILPGSGISAVNAVSLVEATGCDQIHGSFSSINPVQRFEAGVLPDFERKTSSLEIREVRASLNKLFYRMNMENH